MAASDAPGKTAVCEGVVEVETVVVARVFMADPYSRPRSVCGAGAGWGTAMLVSFLGKR